MPYRWRGLSFEAPKGRDESNLLFVDEREPPRWNFDVRVDALPKGADLGAYVDAQAAPDSVVQDRRAQREVAGRAAIVLEQHLDADGSTLLQRQAFVADGEQVVIGTMTARAAARKDAEAAFERWLDSLRFEEAAR